VASERPILSEAALADLDEIWLFIARDNLVAADRVIDDLYTAIHKLARQPGLGHLREDLTDEPLRFWSVYHYQIIYRSEAQPIEVVRVVSGYRDVSELLG
jgi:plasmid stabilization system protein ParE